MNKKAIAWLYQELPELVTKGILPPETAEKLREHYGPIAERSETRTLLMISSIIGVMLVGLGIILLIAHNWYQLSRFNRLAIAAGLLLAAQLNSGLVLYFRRDSNIWRESASILHILMIGAAVALVGQTYHLTEDTDAFLLTWILLSMPLVYLMRSTSAAIMYLIGAAYWSASIHAYIEKQLIWLLLALVLPYYLQLIRQHRFTNAAVILSWVLNLCIYLCFGAAFSNYINVSGIFIYNALFAANFLIGILWFNSCRESWLMPFKSIGLAGIIGSSFLFTFKPIWYHLNFSTHTNIEIGLVLLLLLAVIGGNYQVIKQADGKTLMFSFSPLIVGAAYLLQFFDSTGTGAAILMNIYMLILSLGVIRTGVSSNRIGIVNIGMLMLAALIAARFLDMNFSFEIRGLVFISLGLTFLAANWLMVRRKAGERNEK